VNQFSGTLPGSWAQSLPKVQILSLQSNRLSGEMPLEWALPGAFQNLEEIYLQDNMLEGQLPKGTAQVRLSYPRLRIMDLSYNRFRGSLPAEWGVLGTAPSLELIYLRDLRLNDTLPAAWGGGLPRLRQLWLDGNDLSGTIPAEWASFPDLEQVYVRPGNERLCGPLPPGIRFKAREEGGQALPAGPPAVALWTAFFRAQRTHGWAAALASQLVCAVRSCSRGALAAQSLTAPGGPHTHPTHQAHAFVCNAAALQCRRQLRVQPDRDTGWPHLPSLGAAAASPRQQQWHKHRRHRGGCGGRRGRRRSAGHGCCAGCALEPAAQAAHVAFCC
jgi:hypothetical protein